MEILKFWKNAPTGADVTSDADDARNAAAVFTDDDYYETDDEDSLFDLNFKSPNRTQKKESQFIESPRDVFLTKNHDFVTNSKPSSPVTTLRSAPKFRAFTLGFKKSSDSNAEAKSRSSKLGQSNRFSAPVTPVFSRDNSLRSKMLRESLTPSDVVLAEKSVAKFMKLIKPFYAKKPKVMSESVTPTSSPMSVQPVNFSPSSRKFSEGSRVGSFKIVTRNLVKSRSASAAVGAAPPSVRRRDDSLLEQNDGIQGAILHCKRSFASQERSQLFRSASDPSARANSCEELKRCSI